MRKSLSEKYIRGSGIEIGALHFPTPVLPECKVTYVDRVPPDELAIVHSDVTSVHKDYIVDSAESLEKFHDSSLCFIIANHVLEHCQDVIQTLAVWMDRLKSGGIVYAALPEKTQTFDRHREITPIEHLWRDFTAGPLVSQEDHYRDYFQNVDGITGQALEDRVALSMKEDTNIHFHVWDRAAQHDMFNGLKERLGFEILEGVDHGSEIIWILRKK